MNDFKRTAGAVRQQATKLKPVWTAVVWVAVGIWALMWLWGGFAVKLMGLLPLLVMTAQQLRLIPAERHQLSWAATLWAMPFLLVAGIFNMRPMPTLFFAGVGVAVILFFIWSMVPSGAYSGRFMRRDEAKKFGINRQEESQTLIVARLDGQPIGIKPFTIAKIQKELGHLTVVAPTRSGKGLLLASHLLSWEGSAIVLDIKGENWQRTSAHRAELGPVYVLNPEGFGARFDPIAELLELGNDSEAALLQAANIILKPEEEKQKIFALTAVPALRAGMRVAYALKEPVLPWIYAQSRAGMRAYARNVQAQAEHLKDWASIDDITEYLGRPLAEMDEGMWSDAKGLPVQAWSNFTAALGKICTEGVLKMTSGRDFTAAELKQRPTSVYLVWKEDMGEGLKDAFSLISMALVKGLSRYADDRSGQPMTEVLFIVDEAGTFKVPDLPKLMATLAGRGVWLSPYFQNVVQMQRQYGDDQEQEIINNSSAVVWYPSAEKSAGDYVEQFAGKASVMTSSSSAQGATISTTDRPVMTASEFSQMGENALLVQFRNHAWLKAEPMRWFDFDHLKQRSQEKGINGNPIAWSLSEYRSRVTPIKAVTHAQPAANTPPPGPSTNTASKWYGLEDEEQPVQELN